MNFESFIFYLCLFLLTLLAFYILRIIREMDVTSKYPEQMIAVPTQHMTKVYNPFDFTIQPSKSSVKDGITFNLTSKTSCCLLVCWGPKIKDIYGITHNEWEQFYLTFSSLQKIKEALVDICLEVNDIFINRCENKELSMAPSRQMQLGTIPRLRYPLALIIVNQALLEEGKALDHIRDQVMCQIIFVHLNDEVCPAPSHVIGNFVRTPFCQPCNIQALYPSEEQDTEQRNGREYEEQAPFAENSDLQNSESPEYPTQNNTPTLHETDSRLDPETSQSDSSIEAMCIVCQTYLVDRVILPCRHACVCEVCFPRMDQCPMCRGMIISTFRLGADMRDERYGTCCNDSAETEPTLPWWERWNNKINAFFGFT